jgi:hypothetical protein
MQPIPEDIFQKLPKLILEATRVAYTDKHFFIALKNGQNITVQAVDPAHMKQIVQSLQHQLKEYEKKHGEVKAEWTPNMLSPIQLKKPAKGEGT